MKYVKLQIEESVDWTLFIKSFYSPANDLPIAKVENTAWQTNKVKSVELSDKYLYEWEAIRLVSEK